MTRIIINNVVSAVKMLDSESWRLGGSLSLCTVCHQSRLIPRRTWFYPAGRYAPHKIFPIRIHQEPCSVRQSLDIYCYVSTSSSPCICSYLLRVMYIQAGSRGFSYSLASCKSCSTEWLKLQAKWDPSLDQRMRNVISESEGPIHHSVSVYLPGDKVIRPWKVKSGPSHLRYHSCIRHCYDFLYYS